MTVNNSTPENGTTEVNKSSFALKNLACISTKIDIKITENGKKLVKSFEMVNLDLKPQPQPQGEIKCENEKAQLPASGSSLWNKFAGITLTVTAALFQTLCAVIVKYVSEISVGEMTTYRYVVLLLLSFILVSECKEGWFGPNNWTWRMWMLIRGISGTTNIFLFFLALKFIPLAEATVFLLSVPVFVFIVARIFLGEAFGRWHILAMFISTVGMTLASKIDFSWMYAKSSSNSLLLNETLTKATTIEQVDEPGISNHLIGILLCMCCIVAVSFVYVSLRKIRTTNHAVIMFNFAIIGLIEMLIINSVWFQFRLPRQEYNAYLVMALGVFTFFGQFFLTKACQFEEAGVVAVIRSSAEAAFAFVFQVVVFGEALEASTVCGAFLVLSAIFLLSFRKYIIGLPDDSSFKKKFKFLSYIADLSRQMRCVRSNLMSGTKLPAGGWSD